MRMLVVSMARRPEKVLKTVIVLDTVEVMDMLFGRESAPKMTLHDLTMLEDVEAASGELNVTVGTDSSSNEVIATSARAEAHMTAGCS